MVQGTVIGETVGSIQKPAARLPTFHCGCSTKLVQFGGKIAELASDNRVFFKISSINNILTTD